MRASITISRLISDNKTNKKTKNRISSDTHNYQMFPELLCGEPLNALNFSRISFSYHAVHELGLYKSQSTASKQLRWTTLAVTLATLDIYYPRAIPPDWCNRCVPEQLFCFVHVFLRAGRRCTLSSSSSTQAASLSYASRQPWSSLSALMFCEHWEYWFLMSCMIISGD